MASVPDRPANSSANLPARRLSATEVEAVLRRAVELQARESDARVAAAEGMSDAELIRIGEELGLSPRHVQQALVETSEEPPAEEGWFGRGFGPGTVRVSRLVRRDAEATRGELDAYMRDRECMVVHRRFPERVVYTRASNFVSSLQRAAQQFGAKYPLLNVSQVEVAIRGVDERTCSVSLGVDHRGERSGHAAGGLAVGGITSGVAAVFLGLAVAPPAALVALPLLPGSLLGFRAAYRSSLHKMQGQMESLLDRLEHRELVAPDSPGWRERFRL
jgi:hypothetical protein